MCRRSSPSLRYSDRFLCAAYFVLLHGALTLPIACHSILPTLIRMQRRGILWPGTVNASYRIVLTMLHHRPFWQAVGDNFPVKQIGELATGTTFPLYRELCNIRPHFSLAFIAAKFRLRILGADHLFGGHHFVGCFRLWPDGFRWTLTITCTILSTITPLSVWHTLKR